MMIVFCVIGALAILFSLIFMISFLTDNKYEKEIETKIDDEEMHREEAEREPKEYFDTICATCRHWENAEFANLGHCLKVKEPNERAYLGIGADELMTTYNFYCGLHEFKEELL